MFFSTSLFQRRPPFDFVDLYIPTNPFNSLANNVVPAVVLFAVVLGAALIGCRGKGRADRGAARTRQRPYRARRALSCS